MELYQLIAKYDLIIFIILIGLTIVLTLSIIVPKNNAIVQTIDSEMLRLLKQTKTYEAVGEYFQEKGYAKRCPLCWGRNKQNQLVLTFRLGWNDYCYTLTEHGWTACH